jgi:hypothetical protein
LKEEMGFWIARRLKKGVTDQSKEAQKILDKCKIEEEVLVDQWADQKSAQISIRSRKSVCCRICTQLTPLFLSVAPKRLQAHLGNILDIHTDINELEATIEKSLKLVSKGSFPETCRPAISNLQAQLEKIEANAQSLTPPSTYLMNFPPCGVST